MAESAGKSISYNQAGLVILTAAAANMAAKCVLAAIFGGLRFAAPLLYSAAASAAAVAPFILYSLG
jgi:uncharacterized membrane protein (DUF4010 family)